MREKTKLMDWIKLLRIHQYTKNLFLFMPLFFAGKINNIELLSKVSLGFISFCILASAVYILNDLKDIEEDRAHTVKKFRPLASKSISQRSAIVFMFLLIALSFLISYFTHPSLYILLIWYLILNIAYSFKLKHISILDITIISMGFLIRLVAGAIIGQVKLTIWIIFMVFILALFLSLAKRRDDLLLTGNTTKRISIDGYNFEFINACMTMLASVIIVSYIFYSISPEIQQKFHTKHLYYTALFIIVGIMRYFQITLVDNKSGNPSMILLKDRFLQMIIYAWLLTFVLLIYRKVV